MMLKTVLWIALLLFIPGAAFPASGMDGNALLATVDGNLHPESFEMYRKLVNLEPDGAKKEFVLYTVKKGKDRVASLFLSPPSEKGRTTLRVAENIWLYIPSVGKPIRITSLQSVTGGIFNNSDIMRVDYSVEYACASVDELEERYLLHLEAKSRTVAYDALEMAVDREHLLPTEIKCYASSGMLLKTLRFMEIKDFGDGLVRPSIIETESPLYKGYRSIMLFARMKRRELSDEIFTLSYMPNLDSLR